MPKLVDYSPETFEKVQDQLICDQLRWGDTWRIHPVEGQEERTFARFKDYFDQWKYSGVPIPWEKVIGEAHICMTRVAHPEALSEQTSSQKK